MNDLARAWTAFAQQPLEVDFRCFTPLAVAETTAALGALPGGIPEVSELARLEPVFSASPVARFFQPPSSPCSAARHQEWIESRRALVRVLEPLLARGADPLLVRASLSHAEGAVLAAATVGVRGLGVDLEKADRSVSVAAFKRLSTETERRLGVPALWLWVVKECCFKADPENASSVLTSYEIVSGLRSDAGLEGSAVRTGTGSEFRFSVVMREGWVLGVAVA